MAYDPLKDGIITRTQIVDTDGDALKVNADGSLPISGTFNVGAQLPGTVTVTNVGASVTAVTLAALNTNRRGLSIFNNSSALLYLKLGSGATTSSFTAVLNPQSLYELPEPIYQGIVTGIWLAAAGNAGVTETI